jgi:hypothetical protein
MSARHGAIYPHKHTYKGAIGSKRFENGSIFKLGSSPIKLEKNLKLLLSMEVDYEERNQAVGSSVDRVGDGVGNVRQPRSGSRQQTDNISR